MTAAKFVIGATEPCAFVRAKKTPEAAARLRGTMSDHVWLTT